MSGAGSTAEAEFLAAMPEGACDCHAHVFGPLSLFPFSNPRSYTPGEALPRSYEELLDGLHLRRAVLVQPSVYGTDNRAMLAALRSASLPMRGVAVVNGAFDDEALESMHRLGVRGVRVNLLAAGGVSLEDVQSLLSRIARLGWHVQLLLDIAAVPLFYRLVQRFTVPVVIDHFGHMRAHRGAAHPVFRNLLALVRDGTWVKLSAPYRISDEPGPPYADVAPLADALVQANPGRVVWGSDWPHPMFDGVVPRDVDLLRALFGWIPDQETRNRLMVENPKRLYGFE